MQNASGLYRRGGSPGVLGDTRSISAVAKSSGKGVPIDAMLGSAESGRCSRLRRGFVLEIPLYWLVVAQKISFCGLTLCRLMSISRGKDVDKRILVIEDSLGLQWEERDPGCWWDGECLDVENQAIHHFPAMSACFTYLIAFEAFIYYAHYAAVHSHK